MAHLAQSQTTCPSCGGNEIQTDRFYGNKLKRGDFFRQLVRKPVFWIGIVLEFVDLIVLPNLATSYTGVGFLGFGPVGWIGWILTLIAIVPAYRATYGNKDVSRYPEVGYTCRDCEHEWTSEKATTRMAPSDATHRAQSSRVAMIVAVALGITTLVGPTFMFLSSGGEICSGYQTDTVAYFAKILPLALVAVLVGVLLGRAFVKPKNQPANRRFGLIAVFVVIGGFLSLANLFVAVYPGC